MSGMEGLGRVFNVAPIATGVAINLTNCSGITFVCTGADTFTLTAATSFGGAYATPGTIINHYYQATATNGTAAWTKQTQAASNAVVQAGANVTVIEVPVGMLSANGYTHIKCTASAAGLVSAYTHDLTQQRTPANLPKVSA